MGGGTQDNLGCLQFAALQKQASASILIFMRGIQSNKDQWMRMLVFTKQQACIKVFGAWDPKKVPGNVRNVCA